METDPIRINFSEGSITVLNACLALIMFGVALGIKPEHFYQLRQDRKALFTGLFCQYIFLPVITVVLVYMIDPPKDIALGMILVASCPGGNASNFFSMLAKGNLALSVTLSAFTSVFCFILTPASFFFWSSLVPSLLLRVQRLEISFQDLFVNMVVILLLPLLAGMVFAKFYPKTTERMSKILRTISMMILIGFIVVAFSKKLRCFQEPHPESFLDRNFTQWSGPRWRIRVQRIAKEQGIGQSLGSNRNRYSEFWTGTNSYFYIF